MKRIIAISVSLLCASIAFAQQGKWHVQESKDPFKDTSRVFFGTDATEGRGVYGNPVMLVIRFNGDDVDFFINWHTFITTESATMVLLRIDKDEASEDPWMMSSDDQATFYNGELKPFLRRLLKASSLVARVTPFQENPITAIFSMEGLGKAIEKYPDLKKWIEVADEE